MSGHLTEARLRLLRVLAHGGHIPVTADTARLRELLVTLGYAEHVRLDTPPHEIVGIAVTDAGRARVADYEAVLDALRRSV